METIGPLRSRTDQIGARVYWGTVKCEYDASDNILYWGAHHLENAGTDLIDWVVKKFSYDASDNLTDINRQTTSWDARATGWP